ncbi:MAG: DUF4276 family protein [Candidatus Poribacteria bacterium]|nr:DUF4276 family protein [Candidatus Poribacteria bacterium]
MKKIIIVCEGQTEEAFVNRLLYNEFWRKEVFLEPRLIPTSPRRKGGGLNRRLVFRFLRHALLEQNHTYVTTFFDLYSLPKDLHELENISATTDPLDRATIIEAAFHKAVVRKVRCRPERFFPHIQPHEFEALLFSDTNRFVEVEPEWKAFAGKLASIRESSKSPEYINDGVNTHPSARLQKLLHPGYKKVTDGIKISTKIGLACMRSECQHFDGWLRRIENLPTLD